VVMNFGNYELLTVASEVKFIEVYDMDYRYNWRTTDGIQILTLEQAMKIPEGGGVDYISTLSLTSALDGGVWSARHRGYFIPEKDPVPIVYEAGWAPGPV
jgi:hypothetical protein